MRLVAEWLAEFHGEHYYQTRVRLGSLPLGARTDTMDDGEQKLVHNAFARWVDAIVALPDRTLLVEAKIVAHPGALSQLMLYERLIPDSFGLNLRKDKPIEKVLLFAKDDPLVSQMALELGITIVQFHPEWIDEKLASKFARQRSAPRPQSLAPAN
jgi:hypothetical protein